MEKLLTKEKIIIAGIILAVILINVFPLLIYGINKNSSYSYDYYQHAIGANSIIDSGKINFEEDPRIFTDDSRSLFYPPGFMIYISEVSLISGVDILYLPALFTTLNWIIFILLTYLIMKIFTDDKSIIITGMMFSILFIPGSIILGFSYFVPPVICAFLIWATIIFIYEKKLSLNTKILLVTPLITTIVLTHRPSTVAWILIMSAITLVSILVKDGKYEIATIWISSLYAFEISFFLILKKIIENGSLNKYLYGQTLSINANIANYIVVGLFLVTALIHYLIHIKQKNDLKNIITQSKVSLKTNKIIFYSLILISILFFVYISIDYVIYLTQNGRLVLDKNPVTMLFKIWNQLNNTEFFDLKRSIYIFHLGIITVLLYLSGLYSSYKNKKVFIILSIPAICITGAYALDTIIFKTDLAVRILIYIIPFIIFSSALSFNYIWKQKNTILNITLIMLLLANIILSLTVITANSKPWPPDYQFRMLSWLKIDNNNEKILLMGPGFYANPGNALNLKIYGLYRYNIYTINNALKEYPETETILFLDSSQNRRGSIINMQKEINSNSYQYNTIYNNNIQIIYKKLK